MQSHLFASIIKSNIYADEGTDSVIWLCASSLKLFTIKNHFYITLIESKENLEGKLP